MKKLFYALLFSIFLCCSSSDDSSETPPEEAPVLAALQITSSNGNELDLFGTSTTALSVTGIDQSGQNIAIDETVTWSASNNNVSIDQEGMVAAQSTGTSVITARVGSIGKTFSLTIVDTTPIMGTFIYVSDAVNFDTGPWKILRYDENGQNAVTFIDDALAWPQDILFLESENQVLISSLSSGEINRYNAMTGDLISSFATGISGPTRIKVGADSLLYVLQWTGNGRVLRYELDGTFVDEFTTVSVSQSIGLDWDSNGNLYVSSFDGASVRKFDSDGNDQGLFVSSGIQGPTNIWFDDNDNLFINDWRGNAIVKYDASGNFVETVVSTGLNQPEGVDFFPNGDFIIGSGGTGEVRRYDADGNFIGNLVSSGAGGLVRPNAVRIREIN